MSPVFLAAFLTAVWTCSTGNENHARTRQHSTEGSNRHTSSPVPLGASIFFRHDDLGFPLDLALVDKYLVVLNSYAAPYIHVIDKDSGALVRAFGRTGEGPGEFKFPRSLSVATDGSLIWVTDPSLGRITEISTKQFVEERPAVNHVIRTSNLLLQDVLRLPRSRFLGYNANGLFKFLLLNDRGEEIARRGPAAPFSDEVPQQVAGRAYADVITVHPDGNIIAAGGVWTGALVLYDLAGEVRDSADAPDQFQPTFDIVVAGPQTYMRPDPRARRGYRALAATDEYIIALFSGRTELAFGEEAIEGRDLHVFTWDGDLVGVFRVDVALVSIVIDERRRGLFGSRWEDDPSIVWVELPFLLP